MQPDRCFSMFFRCQCKGKAYYGRKLPLHGKVRTSEFGAMAMVHALLVRFQGPRSCVFLCIFVEVVEVVVVMTPIDSQECHDHHHNHHAILAFWKLITIILIFQPHQDDAGKILDDWHQKNQTIRPPVDQPQRIHWLWQRPFLRCTGPRLHLGTA